MKRSVLYTVALLPALMALRFGPITFASGAKARHTIIAATGAAAPAGGNYFSFFNARLKARPEVAFDALLSGPSSTGVFVGDGSGTSAIALGGNPDPAAGNFGFVNDPFITINGKVVFADVNSGSIFASNGRETIPLVQDGDLAPGGGTLIPQAHPAVNNGAAIAYQAFINGSTATQGIFRTNGAATVAIARDDIGAPTGGSFISLRNPVINDFGQVAFEAEMTGGTGDFGIFRGDGGDLVPVFVANQLAPGGGTFTDFGDPVINIRGQVAAVASLTNSTSPSGLFVGDGTNAVAIALTGQPAPKGGNYGSTFPLPLRLNDRGDVAFHVALTGGTSTRGIFRGDGEQTTTVALAGTNAPGTTGTFLFFHDIKLANNGRIAFIATLTPGVGGVDTSNNMGIWVGTSDEDLQLVVRTGDVIDGHLLTRLSREAGGLNQFDMNETGVVWIGSFQSPAKAIVFSQFLGQGVQP